MFRGTIDRPLFQIDIRGQRMLVAMQENSNIITDYSRVLTITNLLNQTQNTIVQNSTKYN